MSEIPSHFDYGAFTASGSGQRGRRSRSRTTSSPSSSTPLQTPQTPPGATLPSQLSVEDMMALPGRTRLTNLHPDALGDDRWFGDSSCGISKSLNKMENTMLSHPYPQYSVMPLADQDMWFRQFAQEFRWDPQMTALVRREFDAKAGRHYSKKVNEWNQKWQKGEVPKEMLEKPELWHGFIAHWQREETKQSSTYHSSNRNSQRNGKGLSTHNLGATSKVTKAKQMAKELGRDPNHLELLLAAHTDKNGVVQDPVARDIQESVRRMEDEYILSQPVVEGTPPVTQAPDNLINEFFLKVAPQSKGRIYGVPDDVGSSGSSHYYSESSQLRAQMQQKDAEIEELKTTVKTIQDAQAADREKMQRMMEYLGRNPDFGPI